MTNGRNCGGVVLEEFARPANEAPGSSPYQRKSPRGPRAPSQICATACASAGVRQVPSVGAPFRPQTLLDGLNRHARGSEMTPSCTPSNASHAFTAATLTALSLAIGIGAPTSRFM